VLRVAVAVPIVIAVASQRGSLAEALVRVRHISPAWLALALGAEVVSFLAAAELQHLLLAGAGARVDRCSLVALSYAGTALSATLPAGPAVAGRYTYRTLIRRGATPVAAAWALVATAVLSLVALLVLGLVGAQVRGLGVLCSTIGAVAGAAVIVVAAGAVAGLVWSSRHAGRLEAIVASGLRRYLAVRRAVFRRRRRPPPAVDPGPDGPVGPRRSPASAFGQASVHGLGPGPVAIGLGLATANWLADIAALAVAFGALGLTVPWRALIFAYAVTQVATSIPLLPGSIGIAEGSMAAALVCSGVSPMAAVAGVLVYRIVSFWLVLPTGWLAWTCLRPRPAGRRARGHRGRGVPCRVTRPAI
jgi:hypothetical protein